MALLQESRAFIFRNGVSHRQFLAQWVDVYAVDLKFIVQVRTGRQAGRTDVANDLSLLDRSASFDTFGEALHMTVKRAIGVAVLNDHGVAVSATTASEQYFTVTGGFDRCATRCGIIHAFVSADFVEDGVLTASGKA